jgi:hypothetical protein
MPIQILQIRNGTSDPEKKRRLKEINVWACLPNYLHSLNKYHKPRVITLFSLLCIMAFFKES